MKVKIFSVAIICCLCFLLISCSNDNYRTMYNQYLQNGGKLSYDNWYNMVFNISSDDEDCSEGLEFHLKNDGSYSVAWGTTNYLDKICIPKVYNGKLVTEIEQRNILSPWQAKEIVIPDSITTISRNAFAYFQCLTNFIVPNHISNIEEGAFQGCVSLKSITIPNTIKAINANTFNFCISLEEIILPSSIEKIEREAFKECYQLSSITIPNTVVSIDESAFYECNRLVEIINYSNFNFDNYFNTRIVHQGKSLIKNVDGFKFITINNVNYFISYVGNNEIIVLPKYYNDSRYEMIPYSLSYLTNFGYPSLINVKEVIIPDTIDVIPNGLFHGSKELSKITLPKTITSIGNQIGRETNISDIYYLGTKNEWDNVTFGDSWKYDIGKANVHFSDGEIS